MSEDMQLALQLLAIGMITVFLILFLVVQSARILIAVVNHYWPAEPAPATVSEPKPVAGGIDPKVISVISGVVSNITGGKGKIKRIEKGKTK